MKITNITVNWVNPNQEITVALGRVTFMEVLTINFRLKKGKFGYFADFGKQTLGKDGKYHSDVHFVKEVYEEIVKELAAAYEAKTTGVKAEIKELVDAEPKAENVQSVESEELPF